jgi:hypothetical protein
LSAMMAILTARHAERGSAICGKIGTLKDGTDPVSSARSEKS